MDRVALKMLFSDTTKYYGLVFGIIFATFLMTQQVCIFIGIMARTASQITDVSEADIWVMDPKVQYVEEFEPLKDIDLYRIRGVDGVKWATPYYKGLGVVRSFAGRTQQVILLGVDNDTLIPYPLKMIVGNWEDLKRPDAMVMDKAGWDLIFNNAPFTPGREIELNDKRVVIVALCEVSAPFVTFPIVFTRYNNALNLTPQKRNSLSYVLVRSADGEKASTVARRITEQTGLQALTTKEFQWRSINYYLDNTGIPVNFGITVGLGFLVGALITGQTFYLFVVENLQQFGALKAIGVSNRQILRMVLLQAGVVAFTGYSFGMGLAAVFFGITANVPALRGILLYPEVMAGVGVTMLIIIILASIFSIRRVFTVDPAIVFRG